MRNIDLFSILLLNTRHKVSVFFFFFSSVWAMAQNLIWVFSIICPWPCLSTVLFIFLFIYRFVYLRLCLPSCLSTALFIILFIYLFVYFLFIYRFVYFLVYVPLCLPSCLVWMCFYATAAAVHCTSI